MMVPEWHAPGRILCVRPDYLGDVLMTTPAIRVMTAAARELAERTGRRILLTGSSDEAPLAEPR